MHDPDIFPIFYGRLKESGATKVKFRSREEQMANGVIPPYDPPHPFLLSLHAALCRAALPVAAGSKSDDILDDDFTPLLYDDPTISEENWYHKVMEWLGGLPEDSKYEQEKRIEEPQITEELSSSRDYFDAEVEQNKVVGEDLFAGKEDVSSSNSVDQFTSREKLFFETRAFGVDYSSALAAMKFPFPSGGMRTSFHV